MRAISKNTRKATAITLAAALVIAVYLNWQYARTGRWKRMQSTFLPSVRRPFPLRMN